MNRSILSSLMAFSFAVLVGFGTETSLRAQTNFYTDRATFEADFPGLSLEDFEESPVPHWQTVACLDLINSGTTGPCFQPGEIIPGVDFTYDGPPGFLTLALGSDYLGVHQLDIVWGPRLYKYPLLINFTSRVKNKDIYITTFVNIDVHPGSKSHTGEIDKQLIFV